MLLGSHQVTTASRKIVVIISIIYEGNRDVHEARIETRGTANNKGFKEEISQFFESTFSKATLLNSKL